MQAMYLRIASSLRFENNPWGGAEGPGSYEIPPARFDAPIRGPSYRLAAMKRSARLLLVSCIAAAALLGSARGVTGAASERLGVENPAPGAGTVASSPAGISCESFFCNAEFEHGTLVALTPTPRKGFAFAGFSGDCTGPVCSLTMDAPKSVTVNFVRFAVLPHSKLKRNEKRGTAIITIRVGGPGTLVLAGRGVKRQMETPAAAATLKIPIVAVGRTAKALEETGTAKVSIKVAFTPAEGTRARLTQPVRLIRTPGRSG
jgi:hypothetical protein